MAEKLATLGIERDPSFLYFVRRGDVWRIPRPSENSEGLPPLPERVCEGGATMDANFVYFLDHDGDLARVRRAEKAPRRHRKHTPAARGKAKKQPGNA